MWTACGAVRKHCSRSIAKLTAQDLLSTKPQSGKARHYQLNVVGHLEDEDHDTEIKKRMKTALTAVRYAPNHDH